MNYIDFHIGDWLKKTRALKKVERAILLDLVLAYYVQETHFPDDLEEVYREAHADSRDERKAADYVVAKFFRHVPGVGYLNDDCERQLQSYREKQPKVEQKRANDRDRQDRARERRKHLFSALRAHGIAAPWDATTAQLEHTLAAAGNCDPNPATSVRNTSLVTAAVARSAPPVTAAVTRDNTATQYPVPNTQLQAASIASARDVEDVTASRAVLTAIDAADAMRKAGLASATAGDAVLLGLLQRGVTVEELTEAAAKAAKDKKGFRWALARVRGRRMDAAEMAALPAVAVLRRHEGPDPALAKIEADSKLAAPVPPAVRELTRKMRVVA